MTPQQRYCAAHPERVREAKRRYRERNREKLRAAGLRYRTEERDKVVAQKLRWQRDNRDAVLLQRRATEMNRRARAAGAPGFLRASDMFPPNTPCAYCGEPGTATDHVIPLSRGGSNTTDNIVPCCIPCNSSKRNKLPREWSGRCSKSA